MIPIRQALSLPEHVHNRVPEIAQEASQIAFRHIEKRLKDLGFPVTGDFAPEECVWLDRAFEEFVRSMALNNNDIARMQEE